MQTFQERDWQWMVGPGVRDMRLRPNMGLGEPAQVAGGSGVAARCPCCVYAMETRQILVGRPTPVGGYPSAVFYGLGCSPHPSGPRCRR